MVNKALLVGLIFFAVLGCKENGKQKVQSSVIKVVGAMKNVMWKGELAGIINLDTIQNKKGLYGIGPVEYLTGEILIIDGKSFVSKVVSDSTMMVQETFGIRAPFFVYSNRTEWNEVRLPADIVSLKNLEEYINENLKDIKRPFVFKLKGQVVNADIHIQNLPEGTKVSTPDEAHQGQTSFSLENREVDIVGFFSTEHKGIFTHHDSFIHTHLITADRTEMGHLDRVEFMEGKMRLFFPKQ